MKKSAAELDMFVRKKLRGGYPAGELKNELLAEGYTKEDIESAFYKTISRSHQESENNPGQYPLWFFLAVGLLILGIALKSIQRTLFGGDWTDVVLIAGIVGTIAGLIRVYSIKQKNTPIQ